MLGSWARSTQVAFDWAVKAKRNGSRTVRILRNKGRRKIRRKIRGRCRKSFECREERERRTRGEEVQEDRAEDVEREIRAKDTGEVWKR